MKIPKKITPDHLKDTIVQVVFDPKCPQELVLGRFEHALAELVDFKGGKPNKPAFEVIDNQIFGIDQLQGGFFVDKSGKIKINVSPNSFVFNNFGEYVGWDNYSLLINETLSKSIEAGIIDKVRRIGVRYISQFEQIGIFDILKMEFSIDLPNKNLNKTQIRTEYSESQFLVILNLLNRLQESQPEKKESLISLFDVDVIQKFEGLSDIQEIVNRIDEGHLKQKVTFFSLLKPEFLETLKPIYE